MHSDQMSSKGLSRSHIDVMQVRYENINLRVVKNVLSNIRHKFSIIDQLELQIYKQLQQNSQHLKNLHSPSPTLVLISFKRCQVFYNKISTIGEDDPLSDRTLKKEGVIALEQAHSHIQ